MGYKVQSNTSPALISVCFLFVWVSLFVFCLFWVSLLHMGYKVQPNTSPTFICVCFWGVLLFVVDLGVGPCVPGRAFVRSLASFYKGSEQTWCYPDHVTVLSRWIHHYQHYYCQLYTNTHMHPHTHLHAWTHTHSHTYI